MRLAAARRLAAVCALGLAAALPTAPLAAQVPDEVPAGRWNAADAAALVRRAVALRQGQLADSGLRDYQATARGYLTFLAQLGDAFRLPPKVVKADQIAVEVFWQAPDRSKQIVVGLRDTLLLPGDIGYYRDRYGIVQNNFPDRIRLGEGNDVRDVPHPLSPLGLAVYDYAIGDSVRFNLGDRQITVTEVRFRPRDASRPAAVGTLYIDRQSAQLARMALTFTRAAILDERIDALTVTLENGLVEGRFWLPRRQELEVSRTASWLDFPARGIIRGRWEIGDYRVNQTIPPSRFTGPAITMLPQQALRQYPFEGAIVDSLPEEIGLATLDDVAAVQARAQELVQARALQRVEGAALSGRGISDFVRVNRVEGLAVGAGGLVRLGEGRSLALRARYGVEDEALKGRAGLLLTPFGPLRRLELFAERDYRDVGDVPETSLVRNTIAAQEFGTDWTDLYDVRALGAGVTLGGWGGTRWQLEGAYEWQDALAVNAEPATGTYEPTVPAADVRGPRLSLLADHPALDGPWGTLLGWSGELRLGAFERDAGGRARGVARLSLSAELSTELAGRRLLARTIAAGVVGDEPPPQQLVYLGGPVSAPGYDFHSLVGRAAVSQRLELRQPLPFVAVPLGRLGRIPGSMTLAPYAHATWLAEPAGPRALDARAAGVYPSVGVAGLFFFDLLRVDLARGLRDGRWLLSIDVAREFWGIL